MGFGSTIGPAKWLLHQRVFWLMPLWPCGRPHQISPPDPSIVQRSSVPYHTPSASGGCSGYGRGAVVPGSVHVAWGINGFVGTVIRQDAGTSGWAPPTPGARFGLDRRAWGPAG